MIPLLLLAAAVLVPQDDSAFADRFTPLEGTRPAHWRVVWTDDPATRARIAWTTREPGEDHRVVFAPAGSDDEPRVREPYRSAPYTRRGDGDSEPAWFHHAQLDRLTPGTTYRFHVESDGARSPELSFTTAPLDERPFALVVGGDSRSGWEARCRVNEVIADLAADPAVLAFVHGGDYVLNGDSWHQWSRWLSHHELTTTPDGRVLPIVPTRGNHDYGALFDEVFGGPGDGVPAYYTTRFSPLATLVTLNSNVSVAGDQLTWLEDALPRARADARWLLVSYHRALYPGVKAPGDALAFWPPLFDAHDVDLVFESDGHCIKRTVPIRGGEAHPDGVVYVGEGGLGVPQRTPRAGLWYLEPPGLVTQGHHVLRVDVGPDSLRTRFLRMPDPGERLTVEHLRPIVPPGARWRYRAADDAPEGWTLPGFDAAGWAEGPVAIGYGDDDDATVLEGMRGEHVRVHARVSFDGDDPAVRGNDAATLLCRYDDAFVAYLNGTEVARGGLEPPEEPGDEPRVRSGEATAFEAFPVDAWRELLRPGENVLAVVGINRMRTDRDFTLDPWLAGDPRVEGELPATEVIDDQVLAPR